MLYALKVGTQLGHITV